MKILFQALLFPLLTSLSFTIFAGETLPAQYLDQVAALQRRADKLVFGDVGSGNYHLTKARTWLDLAASEYHQVDTSGIMVAAIAQAETLITALENKQTDLSVDTPSDFIGSERIRTDLWDKITAIKSKNHTCGQRQLAEGEVQLIWAGHEKMESGWSHAESYVRIAENSIAEAQIAVHVCDAIPTVTSAPVEAHAPTQTVAVVAESPVEKITLSGDALFAFNKSVLNPSATAKLDELADKIKQVKSYDEIILVGHTDRLRSDGHPERNQMLSENRAEIIKQYLISKGIDGNKMHASGAGSSQPIVACDDKKMNNSRQRLAACLQPNRRVEIIFHGVK